MNPSGIQKDCLGMTPLHILACSKRQSIELYQVMIEKYPENLIVEDNWGGIPLFYALWGGAPEDIIQVLVDSHKSKFPKIRASDYSGVFNTWSACPNFRPDF